jgi:hypothetical protein
MEDILNGFEVFTDHARSLAPKISIRKNGYIGFNRNVINQIGINNKTRVILLYNKKNKTIAFRFVDNEIEKHTVKITLKSGNCFCAAKSFLIKHAVDFSETRSFNSDLNIKKKVAFIKHKHTSRKGERLND